MPSINDTYGFLYSDILHIKEYSAENTYPNMQQIGAYQLEV